MAARDRDFIDRVGKNTKDARDTRVRLAYHTHAVEPVRGTLQYDGSAADAVMLDEANWVQTDYDGSSPPAFTFSGGTHLSIDLPEGLFAVSYGAQITTPTESPAHPGMDSIRFDWAHPEGASPPIEGTLIYPWNDDELVLSFAWSTVIRSHGGDSIELRTEGYDFAGMALRVDMEDQFALILIQYTKLTD